MPDSHPTAQPGNLSGDIEILGLLPGSSNYTFLAQLPDGALVVYKPRKGETPLWDFPAGTLCRREAAAHLVSSAAHWNHVPPTILRDGPLGEGAVQLFIDHNPSITAFDLVSTHLRELRSIALFDVVANNADRKAGHVLADRQKRLWGIDHGLCFHEDPKLRTVLWHFVGEALTDREIGHLIKLRGALDRDAAVAIKELLSAGEFEALLYRVDELLRTRVFPEPGPGRPVPWPPI